MDTKGTLTEEFKEKVEFNKKTEKHNHTFNLIEDLKRIENGELQIEDI